MTHFTSQLSALAVALLIMAGSLGALVTVPSAHPHLAMAGFVLA